MISDDYKWPYGEGLYMLIQGSHRNLIIKFHDFSLTMYAVYHDARKADTEDHRAYSTHTRKDNFFSN